MSILSFAPPDAVFVIRPVQTGGISTDYHPPPGGRHSRYLPALSTTVSASRIEPGQREDNRYDSLAASTPPIFFLASFPRVGSRRRPLVYFLAASRVEQTKGDSGQMKVAARRDSPPPSRHCSE